MTFVTPHIRLDVSCTVIGSPCFSVISMNKLYGSMIVSCYRKLPQLVSITCAFAFVGSKQCSPQFRQIDLLGLFITTLRLWLASNRFFPRITTSEVPSVRISCPCLSKEWLLFTNSRAIRRQENNLREAWKDEYELHQFNVLA